MLSFAATLVGVGLLWVMGSVDKPTIGGSWSLVGSDGAPVTDRDFRGRYVLLYFGYTNCPDVCPITLSVVADAMRRLGSRAERVQPLFITVDPLHDTPAVLHDYVRSFSPSLIGLTGTAAEIGKITREYHIESTVEPSHGKSSPSIDHTAVLLLVGPRGSYLTALPAGESAKTLTLSLSSYLGA